jgi:uncharacterized Tic20 family protein
MTIGEKINNLKLSSLNYYAFLLHFISAAVIAGVLYGTVKEINFNTNLYGYKIKSITNGAKDFTFDYGPPDGPELKMSADALKGIIVSIFLITALFHLFYWKSQNYIKEVNSGKNRYRWIEYAITASLMIYIYSILSGVKDYYIAFLIVLFNIVLMSFGYFLEMSSNPQAKFMALVMGFFILTIIFTFTYYQFVNNINAAKDNYDIPSWVYAIVLAMIFWWISFGVVGVLYYKASLKGKVNFRKYEKYYIFLSFVSKAFMGYYLTFGLTRDAPEEK